MDVVSSPQMSLFTPVQQPGSFVWKPVKSVHEMPPQITPPSPLLPPLEAASPASALAAPPCEPPAPPLDPP
jgi:hypothetical protein